MQSRHQHLYIETETLSLSSHLKLHASQLRQKSQLPSHPLHELKKWVHGPRRMKQTVFSNWIGKTINIDRDSNLPITPTSIDRNIKKIHSMTVRECLASYKPNKTLSGPAPAISNAEQTLPCGSRRTLAQLRAGKSPFLQSYLYKLD